jgi:TRAP-type mannitol/chloroaromatic compound transport system substrate-binding protein
MKRREFLRAAGIGVAGSAVAAPAIAQSRPGVKWRLTSSFPKSLDTLYGAAETFARYIAEATDNNFQVLVSPAGELAPALEAADAVTAGKVDACHTAAYYFFGKDPTWALFCAVPFGLNARQQNAWFYGGEGMKLMNAFTEKFNITSFPGGNTGAQMSGWYRKEVREPADLNGLKFRIGGLAGRVLAKLGVVTVQVPASEIYSALENGTIDAAEWVGPLDDEKLQLHKVAKFYYYPGWWEGGTAQHFMINTTKWARLPKSYQAIVTTAAGFANAEMQARYDAGNPAALKRVLTLGAILRPHSQSILEACFKAATEVYAEIAATNPTFKDVYGKMIAFRNDEYLWWQVAEYTYDTFMVRQRAGVAASGR